MVAKAMPTTIEASIRVSDGSFESRLVIPVDSTKDQLINVGKMWMEMLLAAVGETKEGK